ncbi:MAG: hypothetical protein A2266_09985 [Bacteroidetes bacterium RIFOXYA12_FULL_40_10]|nr:MAG: hypothetical protein A2266_09985 [Bacteroidetes bacterium RIFOXYA12_FULL_40_10]HBG25146.1 hypothetical protein [Rikenellaceae bacterium]
MKNLISLALISLLILGCNSQEEAQIVDLERNDQVSIFDLVDSISVVKLETNSDCLLKFIYQIYFHKNKFYIFDERQNSIFCFDKNGKFLFKIDDKGRGPKEYEYTQYVYIDNKNDQIIILVPWGFILYYDLGGKFIEKVELPKELNSYSEVYSLNKDTLLFISTNEYRASYYSRSKNRLIKRFLKTTKEQMVEMIPVHKTYTFNDSLFFNDNSVNSRIINLSDSTNPVKYSWNFGKDSNTIKQINDLNSFKESQMKQNKSIENDKIYIDKKYPNYYPFYSIESKRYRGISINHRGCYKSIFFDKTNKKYLVINKTIEGIKPLTYLRYGNAIVEDHSDNNSTLIINILNDKQKKIIQSHNPDTDNPFLIIYHIK